MHPVLTIAGSDSGGGAGIQADLRAITAMGAFGCTVLTAITAQNPSRVSAVMPVTPAILRAQLETVAEAFPFAALKTGMLHSAPLIREVVAFFKAHPAVRKVVDPVMVSTGGSRLLDPDAVALLTDELFPLADFITPNLAETAVLLGQDKVTDPAEAARTLARRYSCTVLVKGGHLNDESADDFGSGPDGDFVLSSPRLAIESVATHGTGCTFSAALAAALTLYSDEKALLLAKSFVYGALLSAAEVAPGLRQMVMPEPGVLVQVIPQCSFTRRG